MSYVPTASAWVSVTPERIILNVLVRLPTLYALLLIIIYTGRMLFTPVSKFGSVYRNYSAVPL